MDRLRRWSGTIALALVVSLGCVAAGMWQWDRHQQRSAAIALVEANYAAPVAPIEQVLPDGAPLDPADVWRPVTARGQYLPEQVLLRNRPVDGQPGFHVLAALRVDDGPLATRVLVVDRGWVPIGQDGSDADDVPAAPTGPVEVVVRLRPDEPASSRPAPDGQVQAIATEQVRAALLAGSTPSAADWPAAATVGAYGALVSEDGGPSGLGRLPAPSTDPGSHLSYAFQWWVFALGALIGCAVLIARESREEAAEDDVGPTTGPTRPATRHRRRPTAEEEEDALLDAQVRSGPA